MPRQMGQAKRSKLAGGAATERPLTLSPPAAYKHRYI